MTAIRNKNEIAKLKEAGRIVAVVHRELKAMIKSGVSLNELDQKAESIIRENGATPSFLGYGGFPASICASVNETLVHGIPSDYQLKDGDVISVDVGAYKDGFHGDAAFTMAVGEITEEHKNLLTATKKALQAALDVAKEGATLGDIGAAIEEVANRYQVKLTREYMGHGVGEQLHEEPAVLNYGTRGQGMTLKAGMVLAIEPMFLIGTEDTFTDPLDNWTVRSKNGKYTAHDEHTVLITKEGCEILTKE